MPESFELATARVATSPTEAKLFKALLEAEGIPAYVDGGTLSDEFAVSRQIMNLAGTQVKVRADHLERAKAVLGEVQIDDADLEAQALAAGPTDLEPVETETNGRDFWLYIALGLMSVIAIWAIWELTQNPTGN